MDWRKKKGWIAAVLLAAWLVWDNFGKPLWNLNVERWAERYSLDIQLRDNVASSLLDTAMSWVGSAFAFAILHLTGPFGLGFALGALLFAFWDPIARFARRSDRRLPSAPSHDLTDSNQSDEAKRLSVLTDPGFLSSLKAQAKNIDDYFGELLEHAAEITEQQRHGAVSQKDFDESIAILTDRRESAIRHFMNRDIELAALFAPSADWIIGSIRSPRMGNYYPGSEFITLDHSRLIATIKQNRSDFRDLIHEAISHIEIETAIRLEKALQQKVIA